MHHMIGLALHEDAMLHETAIAAEVFGVDRSDLSPTGQWYELLVCTPDGSRSPWLPGYPAGGFADLATVDTVVVPSTSVLDRQPDPALSAALRAAHDGGARIAALCTEAFVLAAAGLLDGRMAATHWMHAEQLAAWGQPPRCGGTSIALSASARRPTAPPSATDPGRPCDHRGQGAG